MSEEILCPNPASIKLRITNRADRQAQRLKGVNYELRMGEKTDYLQIYDIQGKKRMELMNFDLEKEIDISGLRQGLYIVKITTGNFIMSEKLIIQM